MNKVINIEYPESLANSLRLSIKDFENEIKTSSLVKLFEVGKVSSQMIKKIEELTLYAIEQQKRIDGMQKQIEELKQTKR